MTIDFSAYPNADVATKARTEEFSELAKKNDTPDAELSKLIQQGIYPEARNAIHDTAMTMLARYGKTKLIQELLAAGANIEARVNWGYTPLICAAFNGHTDTVKVLLEAGANIEALGDECDTALMRAASRGQTETVKALLAAGANIEARNAKGQTALIVAADQEERNDKTVRALMFAGANIAACDNGGMTALNSKNGQIIEMFLKNTRWNESNHYFIAWDKANDYFVEHRTAPESAAEVYQLLAVAPLVDSRATVDFVGYIRKIFAHARWENKERAAGILTEMQGDGRINAETVESILNATFLKRSHAAARLQRNDPGMAR